MANYITEDDIEVSLINILKSDELAYNFIQCDSDPGRKENLNDGTGRTSKKQCVLPEEIKTALYKINPDIPTENIDSVIREPTHHFFTYLSIFSAIDGASVNPACDNSSAESKIAFLIPMCSSS